MFDTSSETQGQIVGARESLNGQKNMARRKVKNGEKSPWGQQQQQQHFIHISITGFVKLIE